MESGDLRKKFEDSLSGLDPKAQAVLRDQMRGSISQEEANLLLKKIYEPSPRQQVLANATEAAFLQFLRGDITKEELDKFVNTLNDHPDFILPGLDNPKSE